jgi:hypothetical protein
MARDERTEDLDQLIFVDRASSQFEVDRYMVSDRSRCGQGLDVLGMRVNSSQKILVIGEIAEGLDPSRSRACPDGYQVPARCAQLLQPFDIVLCRNGSLDQCDVVRTGFEVAGCFRKMRDMDRVSDGQQLVFGVQQRQLATIAGCELDYRDPRFRFHRMLCHRSLTLRKGIAES